MIGLSAGWILYMALAMLTVYDGALSFFGQSLFASVMSSVTVAVCLLVGQVTRIRPWSRTWQATRWIQAGAIAACLAALVFWRPLGLTQHCAYDAGVVTEGISTQAYLIAYVAVVFLLVNWPLWQAENGRSGAGDPSRG